MRKTLREWEAWQKPPPGVLRELYVERRRAGKKPTWSVKLQKRVNALLKGLPDAELEAILGYCKDDLAHHLERQFKAGMSWRNYAGNIVGRRQSGVWVVDHIVPKRLFSEQDAAAAFALTNLRPLWIDDNRRKGGARLSLI